MVLTKLEMLAIAGVLANLYHGRWSIVRNGEPVQLNDDERAAMKRFLEQQRSS